MVATADAQPHPPQNQGPTPKEMVRDVLRWMVKSDDRLVTSLRQAEVRVTFVVQTATSGDESCQMGLILVHRQLVGWLTNLLLLSANRLR
jgi:hypothetical protein